MYLSICLLEILDFNAVIGNKEKVVIQTFYGSVPQMQKDAVNIVHSFRLPLL